VSQGEEDVFEETMQKITNIFIERSGALFLDEEILLWLREIIGLTLNFIDSGEMIDRDVLIAQL